MLTKSELVRYQRQIMMEGFGETDLIVPLEAAAAMQQAIPNCKLLTIVGIITHDGVEPNAGHMARVEL